MSWKLIHNLHELVLSFAVWRSLLTMLKIKIPSDWEISKFGTHQKRPEKRFKMYGPTTEKNFKLQKLCDLLTKKAANCPKFLESFDCCSQRLFCLFPQQNECQFPYEELPEEHEFPTTPLSHGTGTHVNE